MGPKSKSCMVPVLGKIRSLLPAWCAVTESSGADKHCLRGGGDRKVARQKGQPPLEPFYRSILYESCVSDRIIS